MSLAPIVAAINSNLGVLLGVLGAILALAIIKYISAF